MTDIVAHVQAIQERTRELQDKTTEQLILLALQAILRDIDDPGPEAVALRGMLLRRAE